MQSREESKRDVAFVAGKKVGKAVYRNRAKRVLKAIFLEEIERYRAGSYILVAKPKILTKSYTLLKKEWIRVLKKSSLLE